MWGLNQLALSCDWALSHSPVIHSWPKNSNISSGENETTRSEEPQPRPPFFFVFSESAASNTHSKTQQSNTHSKTQRPPFFFCVCSCPVNAAAKKLLGDIAEIFFTSHLAPRPPFFFVFSESAASKIDSTSPIEYHTEDRLHFTHRISAASKIDSFHLISGLLNTIVFSDFWFRFRLCCLKSILVFSDFDSWTRR